MRPAAPQAIPAGVVATLGDSPIPSADEQLLLDRALELGLPGREPRLRSQIVSAMIDRVLREGAPPPPGEDQLRAFYTAHLEAFSRGGRVAVEPLFFAGDAQLSVARAQAARARLVGGEPLAAVQAAADPLPVPVPRSSVTVAKLADSVGRTVALSVDALPPAGVTQPAVVPGGAWVVRLAGREAGELAPFDEVRDDVRAEWRRAGDQERLRAWLYERRSAKRVGTPERLP